MWQVGWKATVVLWRRSGPEAQGDLLGQGTAGQEKCRFFAQDGRDLALEGLDQAALRDSYEVFKDAGAAVVGISSDSVESHAGFANKNRLPFTLLSDAGGAARKAYVVPRSMAVLPGRTTYVIDKGGVVRHVFSDMLGATKHVGEALQALRALDTPA